MSKLPENPGFVPILIHSWTMAVRNRRALSVYSLLVWGVTAAVLTPLLSWTLDRLAARDDVIVGNYGLGRWLVSPHGLVSVALTSSVLCLGLVLHASGLFWIAGSTTAGTVASVRETLRRVLHEAPNLLGFSLNILLLTVPFVGLLLVVPGLLYLLLLREHDINFYLTERPAAWWIALAVGGLWTSMWCCVVIGLFVRWVYALPAWMEGHRPLRSALKVSWQATHGSLGLLIRITLTGAVVWVVVSVLLDAGLFALADFVLERYIDTLPGIVSTVSAYFVLSATFDTVLLLMGMAWAACVWVTCYRLHTGRDMPVPDDTAYPPIRVRTIVLAFIGMILASFVLSGWFLSDRVSRKIPLIIAHRAGAADAPENTLSGFMKVLQDGAAEYCEIDVQMTLDGIVVAAHDKDLMKLADEPSIIRETTFADLAQVDIGGKFGPDFTGERLARLDEFLKKAKGRIKMILEFKYGEDSPLIEETLRLVRKRGMEQHVVVMSLELKDVRKAQQLAGDDIAVGYFATIEIGDLTQLDVDFLCPKDRLCTPDLVRSVQELGIPVYTWTVDDPLRMLELIEIGVDGIITNDPTLAARIVDAVDDLTATQRMLLRFRHFWPTFKERRWWQKSPET